jgi:signal transduction histidine kinase
MSTPIAKLLIPLLLCCGVSASVLVFSERSHQRLAQAKLSITDSLEIQAVTSQILSLVSDAETAQRGFVLTARREYLEPYIAALPKLDPKLKRLRDLTAEDAMQQERSSRLAKLIGEKFAELEATFAVHKRKGALAAQELIETDVGRRTMNEIRQVIGQIQEAERAELIARTARWNQDVAFSRFGLTVITGLSFVLIIMVYFLTRRDIVQRERVRRTLERQVRARTAELSERTAELSELSSNLQRVQEAEKSKLARDIHDELGSILVSVRMDISWAYSRMKNADPAAAVKLARAIQTLDQGVQIKRRIIEDLRPTLLDNLGVGAAISWHAKHACDQAGVRCEVWVPEEETPIQSEVAIALFRVVQEALTNVLRHARATRAWITLTAADDCLRLRIRDDGVGVRPEAQLSKLSHGIHGMRQRITALGGAFSIQGSPGAGTTVDVVVPMPREAGAVVSRPGVDAIVSSSG